MAVQIRFSKLHLPFLISCSFITSSPQSYIVIEGNVERTNERTKDSWDYRIKRSRNNRNSGSNEGSVQDPPGAGAITVLDLD